MTEKRKPTYDLAGFKQAFSSVDKLAVTTKAVQGAAALGMNRQGIIDTIQTMERSHLQVDDALPTPEYGRMSTMFL